MKRYNIFIIATLLLGAVLNTGCSDDFLQKSSLSTSSSGNFWQTADDAYEGLTAVYDAMQNPFPTTMLPTKANGTAADHSTWTV